MPYFNSENLEIKIGQKIRVYTNTSNRPVEGYVFALPGMLFSRGYVRVRTIDSHRTVINIDPNSEEEYEIIDESTDEFDSVVLKIGTEVVIATGDEYNAQSGKIIGYQEPSNPWDSRAPFLNYIVEITSVDEARLYSAGLTPYPIFKRDQIHLMSGLVRDGETYAAPPMCRFDTCDRCGSRYLHEDELYREDQCLCPDCRRRRYVTSYHRQTPHIEFFSAPKEKTDLYLGVELEVDKGGESNSTAAMVVDNLMQNDKLFAYCSHDGSLTNGFEIITMPATLKYHQSIKETYAKVFKSLVSEGYRGHDTGTAGMHVHFSRAFFSKLNINDDWSTDDENYEFENIMKLVFLVEKFWDEIIIFSRRDYTYSKGYMYKISDYTEDCEEFIDRYNKSGNHDPGHYFAVNITNQNTIELRFFRSTLNVETFFATLEFVDKLIRTAKEKTMEEIENIEFTDLLTTNAKRYYKTRLQTLKFEDA